MVKKRLQAAEFSKLEFSSLIIFILVEGGRNAKVTVPPSPIAAKGAVIDPPDVTTVVDETVPNDEELLNSPARSIDEPSEENNEQNDLTDVEMEDVSNSNGIEDVAQMFEQEWLTHKDANHMTVTVIWMLPEYTIKL